MRRLPPNERVRLAFRLLVESRHRGHENGATWERLRDELVATGMFRDSETGLDIDVPNVRRLQESAAYLRRVDKVAIGGDSKNGVYLIVDDMDRRLSAGERVKRLRAEVQELEAVDRALYEQIAGALPLEDAA